MRCLARVWLLLLVLPLLAVPAEAEVFTVTLTNGAVFESTQQPQEATWDSNIVLLLTDVGNWIGISKGEIESVQAVDPTRGFGIRISDSTVAIGWAPNDAPVEEPNGQQAGADRVAGALERFLTARDEQSRYSVNQFAEPEEAQGIPSRFGGYVGSSPLEPDPGRFLTDNPPPQ
ncbi:MAG TPA: hypothetical protein VE685_27865 [Thermoanaerobaculia bacterium]|nr:hypothetical protein [Thermoanaerobaculia bacterium]